MVLQMQIPKYYVYKHTSPSGKIYIGITHQNPSERWLNGRGYKKNKHFHDAIEKYGWNNFKHEILFDSLTHEEANSKEKELILLYKSNDKNYGYNLTSGGDGVAGIKMSDERKKKYQIMFSGKNNPFYGKKHSAKTIALIKKSRKGKKWDYFKGHHHTEEFKKLKSKQMHEKYSNGKNPQSKVVIEFDKEGNELNRYFSLCECSRKTGISVGYVSRLCHNNKIYQEKRYGFSER